MSKAVRFHETGGPEVLQIEDLEVGDPGPNEMCVRIEAIGLNRAEVMFRTGVYLEQPEFPARMGYEGAAVIEALGRGIEGFEVGEKVCIIPAFSMNDYGIYAEQAIVPAHAVVKRPQGLDAVTASAVWMQYLTAWGALINIGNLQAGQSVLITAASSSVGLAAVQIANSIGATSIAVTRTDAKARALSEAGAAHVIVSEQQDIVSETQKATGNRGANIIFDPIAGPGIATLAEAAAAGGIVFIYGNLSGAEAPFPVLPALAKGLTFRGYVLFEFVTDPQRRQPGIDFVYEGLKSGRLKPIIAKTFTLDQIVEAHRYMESNQQFGKIVVEVA